MFSIRKRKHKHQHKPGGKQHSQWLKKMQREGKLLPPEELAKMKVIAKQAKKLYK